MVRAKEDAESSSHPKRSGERDRITTGASKTKSEGLERLRKRRADKSRGKGARDDAEEEGGEGGEEDAYSPIQQSKQMSDYTASSGSEEEGQLRGASSSALGRGGNKSPVKTKKGGGETLSPQDLRDCLVTRERLAGLVKAPWFGEWVMGMPFFLSFLFWVGFQLVD